ncbi:hypothetical protein RF11_16444 [Thelohanellus kitauei]|uniref:Kelch domain-containing protein 10 n=1 Tax=Thelohanellus kitauei TaxID=669202 RepID=A0A0C2MHL6_THEKT|nr:hypothetical protein RF11_16444 [Thelohanellus kitauei]
MGYLSGGISFEGFYTDIWKIDLDTLEWFQLDYILQTDMLFHRTAVVEETYLYSLNADFNDFNYTYSLEKFILSPPTLYRQCLEKIERSLNLRTCIASLPPSIADDLSSENHDPSLDI